MASREKRVRQRRSSERSELLSEARSPKAMQGKEYESWWEDDYDFDNVIIFG